jgi:hypothetical protein
MGTGEWAESVKEQEEEDVEPTCCVSDYATTGCKICTTGLVSIAKAAVKCNRHVTSMFEL